MQQPHNFDVDILIPSSKQKVKINQHHIEVDGKTIACSDVNAIKYGVSLIGKAKSPEKKKYTIDVKSTDGKTLNIWFDSAKVEEMLEEDHTYYYIMSGLWQYVKKALVNQIIEQLNEQEHIDISGVKFNYQGFEMTYKTWFWGKSKIKTVAWNDIKYYLDKGILYVENVESRKQRLSLSLHNDWNAVVLNTLLHYLWQDNRRAKLQRGEKI